MQEVGEKGHRALPQVDAIFVCAHQARTGNWENSRWWLMMSLWWYNYGIHMTKTRVVIALFQYNRLWTKARAENESSSGPGAHMKMCRKQQVGSGLMVSHTQNRRAMQCILSSCSFASMYLDIDYFLEPTCRLAVKPQCGHKSSCSVFLSFSNGTDFIYSC